MFSFFLFSYLSSDFPSFSPIQPHAYKSIIMQSTPPACILEWSRNREWCSMEVLCTLSFWSDAPFSLKYSPVSHHCIIRSFLRQRIRALLRFIPEFRGSGREIVIARASACSNWNVFHTVVKRVTSDLKWTVVKFSAITSPKMVCSKEWLAGRIWPKY